MRRQPRGSTPAAAAPRRATSGCLPAASCGYAPGRGGAHAIAPRGGYAGAPRTDAGACPRAARGADPGAAHGKLADPKRGGGPATLACRWAHWRGRWFAKSPPAPSAAEVPRPIAELHQIKAEIRGEEADQRRAVRRRKSNPLIDASKNRLEKTPPRVPRGSSVAQAIRHSLNQWDGPPRFLDDGRVEIDPNTLERGTRPVALNRKNALLAGSDEGARNWAMLAPPIETRKLRGINPAACFADVLAKLVNNWPHRRLGDLPPWS